MNDEQESEANSEDVRSLTHHQNSIVFNCRRRRLTSFVKTNTFNRFDRNMTKKKKRMMIADGTRSDEMNVTVASFWTRPKWMTKLNPKTNGKKEPTKLVL